MDNEETYVSRLKRVDLIYFIFSFHFYFLFDLLFYFLLLEQLGLGLIGYAVISVTIRWDSHEIKKNLVEGSRISDIIQHEQHMLTSCSTHGHLG